VIAAAAGGALETVVDGETGILADLGDAASFTRAIERLDRIGFDPVRAVQNAERFSVEAFQQRLSAEVNRALARSRRPRR